MKNILIIPALLCLSLHATALAGAPVPSAGPSCTAAGEAAGGNPDDPAYALYRKGYNLILEEKWRQARDIFREITDKYPSSEYLDDAAYWTAYSYRDENRKEAVACYKKFLGNYKTSKYFDDALADLDQLMASPALMPAPGAASVAPAALPMVITADSLSRVSIMSLPTPTLAPMMKMRHLQSMLRGRLRGPYGFALRTDRDSKLDADTRIRLEALNAVALAGEDDRSFTTLRKAALDRTEKQVIRVSAIEALSEYEDHDVLPVFLEIARKDTAEEMQLFAIDYIGSAAGNKEKAFNALMDLYSSLPPDQPEKRKMVFYAIAEVGSDRSIDFLAKVARSHEDYELRREAIYYLGNIGGDKARTVLYEILDVK